MKCNFYDIESLSNVFTLANFKPDENCVDIYYLIDDEQNLIKVDKNQFLADVTRETLAQNKNFTGKVNLFDLHDVASNDRLFKVFGLSDATYINKPSAQSSYPNEYRLVCDTDPVYNEDEHPYLLGYNSYHYDTTMLTLYEYQTCTMDHGKCQIKPPKAKTMRELNDQLFESMFNGCMEDRLKYELRSAGQPSLGYGEKNYKSVPATIRKNMLMSGRHIDVARLNEKQQKVALKRLLGLLGYQIRESDKLAQGQDTIETYEQLLDLIAYNVSDVVNLKELFYHKAYQSSFSLKKQLLKDYPEIIYEEDPKNPYHPNVSPYSVRNDRLTIDSSSAQFATKALCPYDHLHDYDTVSFVYPSQDLIDAKRKEGDHSFDDIEPVNVLDEAKKFFYKHFDQPELREKFDSIYNYYKNIEGKNFNKSKNYLEDHGIDDEEGFDQLPEKLRPCNIDDIPWPNTCMFYYNEDGTPSTCFVNFSTGGIHGAEYNKALYDTDMEAYAEKMKEWQKTCDLFAEVQKIYPDPCDLKKNKGVVIDDVKYTPSTFLEPKATVTSAKYKQPPAAPKEPQLFQQSAKGSWNLNKRYTYTSACPTQHEDFTSYYPNLLRMMRAFWNDGLGYDRYGEIFDQKTEFGHKMKDKKFSESERELYSVMRNGTKLILNSASGAGDAGFESNVRMNNKIISMRIIGQLFTWRIGQAQTLSGAHIPSTNTDGLYSTGLEAEINNKILEEESREINVEIEPEPTYLISKDSNNRMEIEITKEGELGEVEAANGGTLSCLDGPTPTQSLAHPAVLDWALGEYLILASTGYKGLDLTKPFNPEIGMSILKAARSKFDNDFKTVTMFQNVIASSPGTQRFVFSIDANNKPVALQHYNRCFIVKDDTEGGMHLSLASAKVITEATRKKRAKNHEFAQQHDPMAIDILKVNGIDVTTIELNKEATVSKITGIEPTWFIKIDNRDLHLLDKTEIDELLDSLDYDKYLILLQDTFEKNWRNMTAEGEAVKAAEKAATKKTDKETDVTDPTTGDRYVGSLKDGFIKIPAAVQKELEENQRLYDALPEDKKQEIQKLQEEMRTTDDVDYAEALDEQISEIIHSHFEDGIQPAVTPDSITILEKDGSSTVLQGQQMYPLAKTAVSQKDIEAAEHVLTKWGVRACDARLALIKVVNALTGTTLDI